MRLWSTARQLLHRPAIPLVRAVEVKESPLHGRGVFALRDFSRGKIIERLPVILLSQEERELLQHTALFSYYFLVDDKRYAAAVGLGAGSLYNHSYSANAAYTISVEKRVISIRACKPVRKGQEVTLNYNGAPDDKSPVYFPPESPPVAAINYEEAATIY